MKEVLGICLLLALVSPGALLTCYQCFGSDCENPATQECEKEQDCCVSELTETSLVSPLMPKYRVTNKNCAQASACFQKNLRISTLNNGTFQNQIECCYSDLCNNKPVSWPEPEDPLPNGVQCPACFELNSAECQETEDLKCTGDQTKCIKIAADIFADDFAEPINVYFEGCATPNTCYIPFPKTNETSNRVKITISQRECTNTKET